MHSQQQSRQKQSESRRYSRSPGGLYLPLRATVRGHVRWQVLDERGVPEVPRTPSGVAVGPVEGVEQDNLITNRGLDGLAERNWDGTSTTLTGVQTQSWRRRLAIGTGSTAPNVTDTTLDNEVQREATSGTFPEGHNTHYLDEVTDEFVAESLVTRLATMTADRNVTEFGLSYETTGNIFVRELLRDGGGTPITVSLLNGKTLRVDHTLEVRLPAPVAGTPVTINIEEYDAGNNLVDTTPYGVIHGPYAEGATDSYISGVFLIWNPAQNVSPVLHAITSAHAYNRATSSPSITSVGGMTHETYVVGTYSRRRFHTVPTGIGNVTWYGYSVRAGSNHRQYVVAFDDPATYTKVSTDTLRAGLVSSWARA
jgi:hypothetical protein